MGFEGPECSMFLGRNEMGTTKVHYSFCWAGFIHCVAPDHSPGFPCDPTGEEGWVEFTAEVVSKVDNNGQDSWLTLIVNCLPDSLGTFIRTFGPPALGCPSSSEPARNLNL